jgi:hypothetical protein
MSFSAGRSDARFFIQSFDFLHAIALIPAVEKQNVTTPDRAY